VTTPKNASGPTRTDAGSPGAGAPRRPADHALDALVDAEIDDVPAAGPTKLGSRRALVYLGVCLVLIGLNLRTVFSSFAAVLPEVRADAGLPGWAVVALTTAPVTLLGVFAPLAPVLARRFGAERVLLGAMAVLTAGLLLRPLEVPGVGHLPALLAGTAACGAAISLCNVLLPGLVKRDFPHRLGLMGGLYTTAICASDVHFMDHPELGVDDPTAVLVQADRRARSDRGVGGVGPGDRVRGRVAHRDRRRPGHGRGVGHVPGIDIGLG